MRGIFCWGTHAYKIESSLHAWQCWCMRLTIPQTVAGMTVQSHMAWHAMLCSKLVSTRCKAMLPVAAYWITDGRHLTASEDESCVRLHVCTVFTDSSTIVCKRILKTGRPQISIQVDSLSRDCYMVLVMQGCISGNSHQRMMWTR